MFRSAQIVVFLERTLQFVVGGMESEGFSVFVCRCSTMRSGLESSRVSAPVAPGRVPGWQEEVSFRICGLDMVN